MRTLVLAISFVLLAAAEGEAQKGRAIFEGKGNCHVCHGKDAKGTPLAPPLTDTVWINIDGSLDAIRSLIRSGVPTPKKYPAPMPPMGGARLSQAEIDSVAAYVRQLVTGPPRPE